MADRRNGWGDDHFMQTGLEMRLPADGFLIESPDAKVGNLMRLESRDCAVVASTVATAADGRADPDRGLRRSRGSRLANCCAGQV
jgi:hypothetical protein